MGRKPQEINPIRGERLKLLLKEHGMEQKELSERIHLTKEHISYIVTGKRSLTRDNAKLILRLFPNVRYEWLMGYDDFKTEFDKELHELGQWSNEEETRRKTVKTLAFLAGYEIIDLWDYAGNTGRSIEDLLSFQHQGMQIKKDGELLANIPAEKFNLLAIDIQELAELRIKSYLREVAEDG